MSAEPRTRLCFALIHGTRLVDRLRGWSPFRVSARSKRWFEPGSPLWQGLASRFPGSPIISHAWSGTNSHRKRYEAAKELSARIGELRRSSDNVVLIGHSHGGNVGLLALQMTNAANVFLATLGTPFIRVRAERSLQRIGVLFVLLYALMLFYVAGSFAYFASVSRAPEALDTAALFAVLLLILAILFYVIIVKFDIHKRIQARLKNAEEAIRTSCHDTAVWRPIRMLVIYYDVDEVLRFSAFVRSVAGRLRLRARRGLGTMDRLFRWWNPLHFGALIALLVIMWPVNLYILHSVWIMYAFAVVVTITIAYLSLGLLLIVVPFFYIFANEAAKFRILGMSINSVSPLENLLISVQSRKAPLVHHHGASVTIKPLPASERDRFFHSYICHDPGARETILRWIETVAGPQEPSVSDRKPSA
jgi:hypothetical protein